MRGGGAGGRGDEVVGKSSGRFQWDWDRRLWRTGLGLRLKGRGRGVRRDLTLRFAMVIRLRMMKPQILIVQPKPILGMS